MLSPDGTLLIYDANWHAHLYDPELMKKVRVREEAHFRKYGTREIVTEDEETFLATCPITRTVCHGGGDPAGNRQVRIRRLEKELYAELPLFEICARRVK